MFAILGSLAAEDEKLLTSDGSNSAAKRQISDITDLRNKSVYGHDGSGSSSNRAEDGFFQHKEDLQEQNEGLNRIRSSVNTGLYEKQQNALTCSDHNLEANY